MYLIFSHKYIKYLYVNKLLGLKHELKTLT